MEHIKTVLQMLALGAIVAAGMRAAEWLIPAPEMRVMVCMGSDVTKVDTCIKLKELIAKHGG